MTEQARPRLVGENRPAAKGQHAGVLRQRLEHRCSFELAEVRLSVLEEDVRDAPARSPFYVGVGVAEQQSGRPGDGRTDRRLAGTGRADEHDGRMADRWIERRPPFGGGVLRGRLGPVGRRARTGMCSHVSHSPHLPSDGRQEAAAA